MLVWARAIAATVNVQDIGIFDWLSDYLKLLSKDSIGHIRAVSFDEFFSYMAYPPAVICVLTHFHIKEARIGTIRRTMKSTLFQCPSSHKLARQFVKNQPVWCLAEFSLASLLVIQWLSQENAQLFRLSIQGWQQMLVCANGVKSFASSSQQIDFRWSFAWVEPSHLALTAFVLYWW